MMQTVRGAETYSAPMLYVSYSQLSADSGRGVGMALALAGGW